MAVRTPPLRNAPPDTGFQVLDMLLVFLLAAGLGAVIAYHPRTRAKASTLAELEQPKTFILYALVRAVIAKIVEANSNMAFVVFGIGGLMRSRYQLNREADTMAIDTTVRDKRRTGLSSC